MIIQLRGTSGSGKSHLARRVMGLYTGLHEFQHKLDRRQPISLICNRPEGGRALFVPGHYNSPCGGCDTISEVEEVFGLIRQGDNADMDVLYEGLIIAADIKRTLTLHEEKREVHAVLLTTPLELCIASVNERRRAKKPDAPPVPEKNTAAKHRGCTNALRALRAAGLPCHELSRDEAFEKCRELLRV